MAITKRKNVKETPETIKPQKIYKVEAAHPINIWALTPVTGFKLLLSMRLVSALWSNISDCDETYNYWEPTHYLIFGTGFQTWEYSPKYALRSYLYLWLHTIFILVYNYFQNNKILLFYAIRCLIALFAAYADLSLYKGLLARFPAHKRVAASYIWIALFGPGMFVAGSAYLPSTTAMIAITLAYGTWWQMAPDLLRWSSEATGEAKDGPSAKAQQPQGSSAPSRGTKKRGELPAAARSPPSRYHGNEAMSSPAWPVTLVAAAGIVGWPFAALAGVPMALEMIFVHKFAWSFVKWCILSLLLILVPTVVCDSIYFGKLVIAPLNLITYNVFTDHGPDIYGVEPWQYYFVNLFLNFSVAFVAAMACSVFMVFSLVLTYVTKKELNATNVVKILLTLSPFYLWVLIFFTQPHKEERFMFPVYPFLAVNAAIGMEYLSGILSYICASCKLTASLRTRTHFYVTFVFFNLFVPLSIFRVLALVKNYHSGIDLYAHLYSENERMFYATLSPQTDIDTVYMPETHRTVCVGKDWYRFPSHFFMPRGWRMNFVKSEFRGQLPKHFGSGPKATSIIPTHMNDQNLEEPTRYVDVSRCDVLIDIATSAETLLEPNYSLNTTQWYIESSYAFLDSHRSNPFHRAFHLPYLSTRYLAFNNYNILINRWKMVKRKRVKRSKK